MPDFILIDGDKVIFKRAFGVAKVTVRPGMLAGSGPATIGGKKVCVVGDETKVEVAGCPYTAGPFSTPGVGTLKIASLAGDQKATKTNLGGKAVLLKGSQFIAQFEVKSKAKLPPPTNKEDDMSMYSGEGSFMTTNTKFKGL